MIVIVLERAKNLSFEKALTSLTPTVTACWLCRTLYRLTANDREETGGRVVCRNSDFWQSVFPIKIGAQYEKGMLDSVSTTGKD
jgi:hypothetical protein